MKRALFNRLWFQFSAVIVGVLFMAMLTLALVAFLTRPALPTAGAPSPKPTEIADFRVRVLTRDAIVLIATGTALAMVAGILLSRRMTRPLDRLADGAAAIGAGDLSFPQAAWSCAGWPNPSIRWRRISKRRSGCGATCWQTWPTSCAPR